MMKPALIASLLAMVGSQALAAGPKFFFENESWKSAAAIQCFDKSTGPSDGRACAEAEFALQDARLNKAYKALQALYTADQKHHLLHEERGWIQFKERFCKVWGQEAESVNPGLAEDYYVLLCTSQVSSQRASELEYALAQHALAK